MKPVIVVRPIICVHVTQIMMMLYKAVSHLDQQMNQPFIQ